MRIVKSIIKRAKKVGSINIYTNECEKWEDTKWGENGELLPDTGVYDHEGHTCVDLCSDYYPSILGYIKENLYGIWECLYHDGWVGRSMWKYNFRLRLPWSGWIWTLNSFGGLKADIALNKTIDDPEYSICMSKYDKFYAELTGTDIVKWLDENCRNIGCGYWVDKEDETCFFVDERHTETKFDLRDGWSNGKCALLLSDWFYYMGYRDFGPVCYREPDWLFKGE